jgi:hypothetical protein
MAQCVGDGFGIDPTTGKLMLIASSGLEVVPDGIRIKGARTAPWPYAQDIAAANGLALDPTTGKAWSPPPTRVNNVSSESGRWQSYLDGLPIGVPTVVSQMPAVVLTNPSSAAPMLMYSTVSCREVEYGGPIGARFEVRVQQNVNGAGWGDICSIIMDYASQSPGSITERRAMPSMSGTALLNPSGSISVEHRVWINRMVSGNANMVVASSGLRFTAFGISL